MEPWGRVITFILYGVIMLKKIGAEFLNGIDFTGQSYNDFINSRSESGVVDCGYHTNVQDYG